jgi:hypothetical protein
MEGFKGFGHIIAAYEEPERDAWGEKQDYGWFSFEKRKDEGGHHHGDGWMFRPLGGWDYGYPNAWECFVSWTIWALVTWGSFSVDPYEAAGLLGATMYAQEQREWVEDYLVGDKGMGGGASWVHNVQAGYCWYHHFVKGNKSFPLLLGSWAEVSADLAAVGVELYDRETYNYSHKAHWMGASEGMAVAYVLDLLRRKKSARKHRWWYVPFITITAMFGMDQTKESQDE